MSRIFISYCHKDLPWKERLEKHLKPLTQVKRRQYSIWTDDQIYAGEDWEKSIQAALDAATVAVLLVTIDFLNSKFVNEEEIPRLLARRKQEGITIIPVIVRPCLWNEIEWLSSMQCRPRGDKSLSEMKDDEVDAALVQIARELIDLSEKPAPKPVPRFTVSSFEIENFSGGAAFGIGLGDGALIVTGRHDWYWINPRKSISHRLSALPSFSNALLKTPTEVVLSLFDKKLAFLKSGDAEWHFVTMPNAVISLSYASEILFTGDMVGMVSSLQHDAAPAFWQTSIQEPIVQLVPLPSKDNDMLLVLGSSGRVWELQREKTTANQLHIPVGVGAVRQIAMMPDKSPFEGCVLLMSDQNLTVFSLKEKFEKASLQPLPLGSHDVFRKIVASQTGKCFGLLTDEGNFYIVPADMRHPRHVAFVGDVVMEVSDLAPHPGGGFWLWTIDGRLYHIEANGSFKKIKLPPVQCAFASATGDSSFAVWQDGGKHFLGEPAQQTIL